MGDLLLLLLSLICLCVYPILLWVGLKYVVYPSSKSLGLIPIRAHINNIVQVWVSDNNNNNNNTTFNPRPVRALLHDVTVSTKLLTLLNSRGL